MKNIKRQLNLYTPFFRAGTKTEMAYKSTIVMWLIISFVDVFFIVFLYEAIYRNSPEGLNSVINGFTFYEMIIYMITTFVFSFLMGTGETSFNMFLDVKDGTIVNTLTKPVSYRLRQLFTYLGVFTFHLCIVALPLLTASYIVFLATGMLQVSATTFVVNLIFFLIFAILAGLINDAISYFIGLMTFLTDHLFGLNMARTSIQGFLGGQMVPLAYMGKLGVAFSFTPFAFLNSVPVLTLMCKLDIKSVLIYLAIALAWLIGIEFANHLIFKSAIKRLTVQGG